jgi:tetratricopeptide (TPR) repeat protein
LALALAITLVVFLPAMQNDFVNWDDDRYVLNSRVIKDLSPENIRIFFTEYHHGLYQPLTLLSLAIDHAIGGPGPFLYHLVNVILHLFNTGLVFLLIYLLAGHLHVAFIAALLFGIHTLHVESVAWVTERKDVLYAAFFLSSLIAYLRYVTNGKGRYFALALLLFLLSLLSKAQAVSLAFTLFILDFWFSRPLRDKKVLLEKLPFLALSLLFGVLALHAQSSVGALSEASGTPLSDRIAFASFGLSQYVIKLLAPFRLAAIYPYPNWAGEAFPPQMWIYPALVVAVLAGVAFSLRSSKVLAVGAAFFLVNIGLMLQVVPAGTAFMADRFTYVPSVGFVFLVGMGYHHLTQRIPRLLRPLQLGLTGYVILLGGLTFQRVQVWNDSLSLWNDVLEKFPSTKYALNNRGVALLAVGDTKGAIRDFERAIEIDPEYSKPFENRGGARLSQGDYPGAIEDFTQAIRLTPEGAATAFYNRGLAHDYLGNPVLAIEDYDEAIRLDPDLATAYYSRGSARGNIGDLAGAVDDFGRAAQLDSADPRPILNRGVVWLTVGDTVSACRDWDVAAKLGSAAADERLNLICR